MPKSETRSAVCRLIVDEPAGGAWNMAVDEELLESVAEDNVPTLRIWGVATDAAASASAA